jgi:hypothetical protein
VVVVTPNDRESLDASEPRPSEEPMCPLCGTRVAWPWEPGGTVLCHPDRGGCGANVRPVPYLAPTHGGAGETSSAGPARTTWEACCTPYLTGAPSGVFPRHSSRCPQFPNSKLTRGERRGRREQLEDQAQHPARSVIDVPLPIMEDEGYIDAHSDDRDLNR